jgi:large subunit ribosomal protein L21
MYAILSHGGRQYRVSAGDRLLVDRLAAEVGSVVALEPLLLTGGAGEKTTHGEDLEGMRVAATVVAHRRGRKLRIFKYKAKKRLRKVAGYRSDLTELRVDAILVKGAALPAASAGDHAAASPAADRPAASTMKKPASARTKIATAAAQKPAATAAKPATRAASDQPQAAVAKPAKPKSAAAAKSTTSERVSKAAPKAGRGRAAKEKEAGDGT